MRVEATRDPARRLGHPKRSRALRSSRLGLVGWKRAGPVDLERGPGPRAMIGLADRGTTAFVGSEGLAAGVDPSGPGRVEASRTRSGAGQAPADALRPARRRVLRSCGSVRQPSIRCRPAPSATLPGPARSRRGPRGKVAGGVQLQGRLPAVVHGRRMNVMAANLIEWVRPPWSGLRQGCRHARFSWRRGWPRTEDRSASSTRIAVETVPAFDAARAAEQVGSARERGGHRRAEDIVRPATESAPPHDRPRSHLARGRRRSRWEGLGHLRTCEVGEVLERLVWRMENTSAGAAARDPRGRERGGRPRRELAASAVSGQAPPAGPQWASRLAPLSRRPWPTTSRRARRLMGPRCTRRRGRALSTRRGGRRCRATCCVSGGAGARGAACRRSGAHHPEEGLHRRDDRGRHGPAVSPVPAGHQRAPTPAAHHPLRGGAGPGEPLEVASRAGIAPSRRRKRRAG